MVRVKGGIQTRQNHRKILKLAKGFWMTRRKQFRKAEEAVLHAGEYAFMGRKRRKRDIRRLWIVRLNAALKNMDMKYSTFMHALKVKKVGIDRKILAQMASEQPSMFEKLVEKIK
jgi:large subunit ribosomal protein L20